MKRIFLAALAAMTLLAGCAKDNAPTVEHQDVKIFFTVADKPGFNSSTKAAKAGWSNNDKIMIIFKSYDSEDESFTSDFNTGSFLTLTYNGEWTPSDISTFVESLGTNGDYLAYHYRGELGFAESEGYTVFANYNGGDFLHCRGKYSVTENELTIIDDINMAFYDESVFQVSVKGLDQKKTWGMTIADNCNYDESSARPGSLFNYFGKNSIFWQGGSSLPGLFWDDNYYRAIGVNNSDGDVSFWIQHNGEHSYYKDFYFYIECEGEIAYKWHKHFEGDDEHLQAGKHYRLPEIKTENIEYNDDFNVFSEGKWNYKILN